MVNIKDVARLAGVSISSVSNAINGTRYVSEEVKDKVMRAVEELNYEVDPIARSLKSSVSMTLGVILPSMSRIFLPLVVSGMQKAAADSGYHLIIYATDDNFEKEESYVTMLANQRVDGIIIDSVAQENTREYYHRLSHLTRRNRNIPILSLERNLEKYGISSIYVDNHSAGKTATAHLLECGCRRILHISGPHSSQMSRYRFNGYKEALDEADIPHNPQFNLDGDYSPLSGYRATRFALMNAFEFDGIFADNDQMAIGAMKALKEHGKRIPEDVKIVGFDNTFASSIVSPSLTTINVPKFRMGTEAVASLIKLINRDVIDDFNVPKMEQLSTSLLIRNSTVGGKEENWDLEDW